MNRNDPVDARITTIVGMAVSFTSMLRVFRAGSVKNIEGMVKAVLPRLRDVHGGQQFDELHHEFCERFMTTIFLSKPAPGRPTNASYGQAAKVLDVALKACVDFCRLPDAETAAQVAQLLHAPIDTQILKHLKKEERLEIRASTVQDIDRETYNILQGAVAKQIEGEEEFHGLRPIDYDNIMFLKLNHPRHMDGDTAQ